MFFGCLSEFESYLVHSKYLGKRMTMKVCSGNKTRKFGDFEAMLFNIFGCLSEFESYLVHLK